MAAEMRITFRLNNEEEREAALAAFLASRKRGEGRAKSLKMLMLIALLNRKEGGENNVR